MLEDILRDTWFYQKILKEGREEGIEKGIEEGREEERKRELQRLGQLLVGSIEANFPSLSSLAKKCTYTLSDPDALQKVTLQVLVTKDVDVARNYLLTALEEKIL